MTPLNNKLKYKDYHKTKVNSFDIRNKYILPQEACTKNNLKKNVWPCRKTAIDWDRFGVLNTPPSTSKCKGINTSTNVQYNVPNYNPGLFSIPIENYIDRYDPINSYKAIPTNMIIN